MQNLEDEWEMLQIGRNERVSTFNDRFLDLYNKLNRYKKIDKSQMLSTYRAKLLPNKEASQYLSSIKRLSPNTLSLDNALAAVAEHDTLAHGKTPSSKPHRALAKRTETVEAKATSNILAPLDQSQKSTFSSADECLFCKRKGHKITDCYQRIRFQKFMEWEKEHQHSNEQTKNTIERNTGKSSSKRYRDSRKRKGRRPADNKSSARVAKGGYVESEEIENSEDDFGSLSDSGKD